MKYTHFNIKIQVAAFFVFTAVAFLSYQKNFFGFAENVFFQNFEHFSESLVVGDIVADQFGIEKNGWNLGFVGTAGADLDISLSYKILKEKLTSDSLIFGPYVSQFGVQGLFFSEIYKLLSTPDVETLNAINSLLMALVIALLSVLYLNIYNRLFGLIFFVTMISSPWTISFARNLYWVPFTWFLPALFAALAYLSKSRVTKLVYLVCILFSIAIKSLAGYEYLTTITIFTCSVFVLAPLFNSESKGKGEGLKFASVTFLCCIAGFFLALIIHAGMRGDSVFSGLQNIYQMDVKRRTYGDPAQFAPIFKASLESSFWDVLNTYWTQWKTSLAMFIPGKYLGVIFWLSVFGVIYGVLTRRRLSCKEPILVFVFFAATVSWFLFGKAHSYIHTHMNFVLWYFGFIQALLYCLVRLGFLIVADICNLVKKVGFVTSFVAGLIVFFIVVAGSAKYVDNRMAIITSGVVEPIDVGVGFKVIFRDDGKMVFYAAECRDLDLTGRFILHFIPEKVDSSIAMPYGFENRDFIWPTSPPILNWNPLSNNFGSCHTEISIPNYRVSEFRTGQYDLSETGIITVRWSKTIKIPAFPSVDTLTPYNLTDQNWKNGIHRASAIFFIENTLQNRMSLSASNKILLPSSGERAITSIVYTDKYINISLEGRNLDPVVDGYPNKLLIKR